MITLISIEGYGIIGVDLNGNLVWEWTYPAQIKGRIAGFDYDLTTGTIYVAGFTEVLEINKRGKTLWRYSNPQLIDIHSLQLLRNGNILVACAANDRALEISKKEGIVWEWYAKDHFTPPNDYKEHEDWRGIDISNQWTHLNHAWETDSGDILITLFNLKRVLSVNRQGDILWSWGEKFLNCPHYIIPFNDNYLVADSRNNRVIKIDSSGRIIQEFRSGLVEPRGIQVLSDISILVTSTLNKKVLEIDKNDRIIWSYTLPKKIREMKNSNPYTAIRVADWTYEEDSELIEKRLRTLGYID